MRKAFLIITLLFYLINSYSQNPVWEWAKSIHTGADEYSHDLVADPSTNDVYLVGQWENSLSSFFLTGAQPSTNFTSPYGQIDAFVAKYDQDGNLIWAFKVGGPGDDFIDEIVLDPAGNIYITGYLGFGTNPAYFSGMSPHTGSSTLTNTDKEDFFVAKYNSDGEFQWVKRSVTDINHIRGLDLFATSSAVFVNGQYESICDIGSLSITQTFGGIDLFLIKFDLSGNEQWLITGGSNGDDYADAVVADESHVFISGDFKGNQLDLKTISGSAAATLPTANNGKEEIFLVSYDIDGVYNWGKTVSSTEEGFCYDICMNTDSLFITGGIETPTNFPGYYGNPVSSSSNADIFISSHSKSDGNTGWVVTVPCTDGGNESGNSLSISENGDILVTGSFQKDLNFPDAVTLTSVGSEDVFVAKYSQSGNFIWAKQAGSSGGDIGFGISVGTQGSIFVSGLYDRLTNFDLLTLPDDGGDNLFLAKLQEPCTDAIGGVLSSPLTDICYGGSTNLILSSYSGDISWQSSPEGTSTWTDIAGEILPDLVVSPIANTDYRAYLRNGACNPDSSNIITIVVFDVPESNPGTGNDEVCGNTYAFQALLSTSGTGKWTSTGPGTASYSLSDSDPNAVVTVTQYGSYDFTWTESNNTCIDDSTVTVVFYEPPTINPGPGGDICGLTFTFGAIPSVGTGSWSLSSGPGTAIFSPSNSNPDAEVTVSDYGSYTFSWTEINGPCSPGATIFVNFYDFPGSYAGLDAEICITDGNYPITGATSANGTILWTTSGDGTFSDPAIDNPVYTIGSETGAVTLTKTVSSPGSCADAIDFMILTLTPVPASYAGLDDEICISDGAYPITGSTSANGTILWTTSGDGTFSVPAFDNPVYTIGSETGAVTLTKTVSSTGSCADAVDFMILALTPVPASYAGLDDEICISDGTYSIAGATSANGTILWTTSGDGSFSDPAMDNPTYTIGSETGTVTLTKTVSSPGSCSDAIDFMNLSLTPVPASYAGMDDEICISDATYTISGSTSANGTILWSTGGDGVFSDPASDNPVYTIGSETGTVTLTKTVSSSGSCTDAIDLMILTLSTEPLADAGLGGEECDLDFQLRAFPSAGTGTWTMSSGSGSASFVPNENDPLALVAVTEYGTKEFTWTEENGSCSDADIISVSFYEAPTANPGTGGEVCILEYQLGALPSTGSGIWSMSSGPGIADFIDASSNPSTRVSVDNYGTYIFTWTETNGPCTDAEDITVTFYEAPVSNAGADDQICGLEYILQAQPSAGTGLWTLTSGPGTAGFLPDASTSNATLTVSEAGSYTFSWAESNGPCLDESSVEIHFFETPLLSSSPPIDVCGLSTDINVTSNIGTGIWTKISGPGDASFSPADIVALNTVTVTEYGTYEFDWTATNGPCSQIATQVVNFFETPESNAGSDSEVCGLTYKLAAQKSIGTGYWQVIGDDSGISFNPSNTEPDANVSVPIVGSYQFRWEETNGICSDFSIVTIDFQSIPEVYAGPDQTLDFVFYTSLEADYPDYGEGKWSVTRGSGTIVDSLDPKSDVIDLSLGENEFMWTIKTGVCEDVSDRVIILVNDLETPTVITPNNDGLNDQLVFKGIDQLSSSELIIYNRWGGEIYRSKDYKNDWEGKDQKGRDSIPDTYYYILKLSSGRIIKGFIEIRR